ncbi:hypothetical protein RhiirA4_429498, partial [Rhizophagus irregularis]
MAIEGHNRSIHNTVVLHVVLGDFNDTIDNKIDRSPSTEQPGSQFLIQLMQLELYDVCQALYSDTELFTHEKWDKNKDKSRPISRSRIDQIWITHEADVIPVEFSVHSSQMITNSHHSIISTLVNISGFIKNNFRHCVPDQIRDLNVDDRHQNNRTVDINIPKWLHFTQDNVKEHIVIDRAVISNENEGVRLALDPNIIRTHAKDTFAGILRKCNTKSIEQDVFWSNIYRLKGEFTECMANLMDEITIGEWHQTLELVNTNSAPGPSGIGYAIIKHFSDKASYILLKFINMSLKIGVVPDQWKQSLIHPIPKPQKFNYILANTRPIALLDNIRKCVTKVLTNRLSAILTSNKVLRGLNFCGLTQQYRYPVSEDKRKHPYVIIKDKNNKLSIGLVKKRTQLKKKGGKIECLIIEECNIKICLDNPQKAIIQKQECPKIITIAQHNALVLPIFTRLSTGAITHIDWYYMVDSVNRVENITTNIDIQQIEKTPIIELNGDNLGPWINRWIEQDTLRQELTNIRYRLRSLKNIEYYTDGSLANQIIDTNNQSNNIADNTIVNLGAAFYTNNEEGEYSVYSSLSLWPSSTRAEIVAIFLALLTAPENSNVTIYTDSLGAINSINSAFDSTTRKWLKKTNNLIIIKIIMLIREASINIKLVKVKGHSGIIGNDIADKLAKKGQYGNNLFKNNVDFIDNILSYFPVFIDKPIEVNIRRFILKILATGEATEWSLLKNNQELCYGDVNQIDWKITWLIFHYCKGFNCTSMQTNYLWTFIEKLFHKILPLGSILALRKPKLYKEMKCVMNCNKKENWNHLFECQAYEVIWQKILEITTEESIIICLKQKQIKCQGEDFIRNVLQDILGDTAKSKKFQKFQQLALEVKVETCLTTKLQKDFKISLTEAQILMANILIRFILTFKELLWKPRCEQ